MRDYKDNTNICCLTLAQILLIEMRMRGEVSVHQVLGLF